MLPGEEDTTEAILGDDKDPRHPSTPFDDPFADNPAPVSPYMAGLRQLLGWIWKDGNATPEAGLIRSAVVAWMIDPGMFDHCDQVQLAEMLGREHKQSVGREVSDFRKQFKYFNRLMRQDAAIENFKQREETKRKRQETDHPWSHN